ncbi:hypothetical protein SESBI_49473, partial [Sesbania bispinosa]
MDHMFTELHPSQSQHIFPLFQELQTLVKDDNHSGYNAMNPNSSSNDGVTIKGVRRPKGPLPKSRTILQTDHKE